MIEIFTFTILKPFYPQHIFLLLSLFEILSKCLIVEIIQIIFFILKNVSVCLDCKYSVGLSVLVIQYFIDLNISIKLAWNAIWILTPIPSTNNVIIYKSRGELTKYNLKLGLVLGWLAVLKIFAINLKYATFRFSF